MRKQFLRVCQNEVVRLASAITGSLASEEANRLAQDVLVRLVFLRLAEQCEGDLLRRIEGWRQGLPLGDVIIRMLYGDSFTDRCPGVTALRSLMPPDNAGLRLSHANDLSDGLLEAIVAPAELLYRYRFTTVEGMDDPEATMIGPGILGDLIERVGEGRRDRGAYYTPRLVVDYVCRETVSLWLGGYRSLVFENDGLEIPTEQRHELDRRLGDLTILDPACGGGAFLVGMRGILSEIRRTLGHDSSSREWEGLFGTDVDSRAVSVTRLRLWLAAARGGERAVDLDGLCRQVQMKDALDGSFVVAGRDKWDIVVTNPPYGVKAPAAVRDRLFDPKDEKGQSRDAYGLFMAKAGAWLSDGGVAGMVVADTWRTIKSHRPLRTRLLGTGRIARIIALPSQTFDATVAAEIVVLENRMPKEHDMLCAVDLRGRGAESLAEAKSLRVLSAAARCVEAQVPEYSYPQKLCLQHHRKPVFVASPEVFRLMLDRSLVRLGEIAEIRHGLTTGATRRFIYKRPGVSGTYREADLRLVLEREEFPGELSEQERHHGFDPSRFGGRYLVPYDKGGASRVLDRWLPCYAVPTDYFIDWREASVAAMKKLPGFRHDGCAYYFRKGITFSHTGYYAPTFRVGSGGVFDTAGSSLFPHRHDLRLLLALLNSKTVRYVFKNYINHSVNVAENPLKDIPIALPDSDIENALIALVESIMEKQRVDRHYPFHRCEQPTIDRMIYELYGLDKGEQREIEQWYVRRYPRLGGGG